MFLVQEQQYKPTKVGRGRGVIHNEATNSSLNRPSFHEIQLDLQRQVRKPTDKPREFSYSSMMSKNLIQQEFDLKTDFPALR